MSAASNYGNFDVSDLPLKSCDAGEVVIAAGSRAGELLFLKEGAVAITVGGVQIAVVDEPGAVFGEVSALLDVAHLAEVRTLSRSQFHVSDAALIDRNAAALFYIAGILAKRLQRTNIALVALLRDRITENKL